MSKTYSKFKVKGMLPSRFISLSKEVLWETDDHLLCVEQSGFVFKFFEKYKRLYFDDIRAITVEKNNHRFIHAVILSTLIVINAVVMGLSIAHADKITGVSMFFMFLIVCLLIPLFLNWIRGETCYFKIETGVNNVSIASLRRVKAADRAQVEFQAKIARAQGQLTEEQIDQRMAVINRDDSGPGSSVGVPHDKRGKSIGGGMVVKPATRSILIFSMILLLSGVMVTIDVLNPMPAFVVVNCFLYAATIISNLVMIVKNRRTRGVAGLRWLSWLPMVMYISIPIAFYVCFIIQLISAVSAGDYTHGEETEFIFQMLYEKPVSVQVVAFVYIAASLALGILGLYVTYNAKRLKVSRPPPIKLDK